MILTLERDYWTPSASLSHFDIDWEQGKGRQTFGFALEDTDRGLSSDMSVGDIAMVKVPGSTAIPIGRYRVEWTWSNKYHARMQRWAQDRPYRWTQATLDRLAAGKMPQVLDVPGFQGIRIHAGNFPRDTQGCPLVALRRNVEEGDLPRHDAAIQNSLRAIYWLYEEIAQAEARGEKVWLDVVRDDKQWAEWQAIQREAA